MKLLFCHDGPMKIDKNGKAYPQTFTPEVLSRYYTIADDITMIIRTNLISPEETNLQEADMNKFHVIDCPNLASVKGVFFNRRKARSIIEREIDKYDLLIVRLPSRIGILAIDVAKKRGKRYLIEMVACPWDAHWNYSLKGKIVAPFIYKSTKKRIRDAEYVVYVTNKFLQSRYPTNGKNVSCSNVALKEFNNSVLEKRIRKIENHDYNNKLILGTAAAVDVRFKGQQYIIQAIGKLKKQGINNIEYQLVGGGDQSYLKSIAKKYGVSDKVKFLGSIPHNEVFDWLENIDIYVQPSRQEGLPRALIEAMSKGLPAFGANTAGIPELLESKFIFSNTLKNINEICRIIQNFDKEVMSIQAKRNFEEAKKYNNNIIENRRKQFFYKYKNSI